MEGTRAAEILQREGINCNMTLLFSLPQAVACAEANAKLISPFVGRILDWYRRALARSMPRRMIPVSNRCKRSIRSYKKFDYKTEVMAASFRNVGEILELAGTDLMTISPALLTELKKSTAPVERKLSATDAKTSSIERIELTEPKFRFVLNEDAMATEKTAEGIRVFAADARKLKQFIAERSK